MADSISASKIHSYYDNDTDNLYGILRNLTGSIRDIVNSAWDAWPGASQPLTDHDISIGTASGSLWIGGFPNLANAFYIYEIRKRVGGSPNTDDPVISATKGYWNGSEVVPINGDSLGRVRLAPNGLDDITATDPSGYPSSFRDKLLWLVMRFVNEHVHDTGANTLVVKNGSGVIETTQATSDVAGVETVGKAS